MKLSSLDVRILDALQRDAKLSMQELGGQVGASSAQVWRRLKLLRQSGVLEGYHARLSAKSVGLGAAAFVHVALSGHDPETIEGFLRLVMTEDQVVECASVTGEHDFIILIHAEDPEALESFIMRRLLNSGYVSKTQSNFVLRQAKTRGPLPLSHLFAS